MTRLDELNQCECEKLDPLFIDAFIKHYLDPENTTRLILDSSWGESDVDLTPAIKAGETITHLFLTPADNPTALQYNREDFEREGVEDHGIDCIEGDALSRIISMRYLKDVDQNTYPRGGDIYMWDEVTNLFYTFNLQDYMDKTDKRLDDLEARMSDAEQGIEDTKERVRILENWIAKLQKQVDNYIEKTDARLAIIEATIAKPSWAPSDSRLTWSNINDCYAASPSTKGIYGHNPAQNVVGDQQFQ